MVGLKGLGTKMRVGGLRKKFSIEAVFFGKDESALPIAAAGVAGLGERELVSGWGGQMKLAHKDSFLSSPGRGCGRGFDICTLLIPGLCGSVIWDEMWPIKCNSA